VQVAGTGAGGLGGAHPSTADAEGPTIVTASLTKAGRAQDKAGGQAPPKQLWIRPLPWSMSFQGGF